MRILLKGGTVVNVFTGRLEKSNVLFEDEKIVGLGDYGDSDADRTEDVRGKVLCPGFIDGHIHIESTMLLPGEFARVAVPHGTTAVVADPHEIANVCGRAGVCFMLEASEGLPMTMYFAIPSCVPSTPFDETGARLEARDIAAFYSNPRVLGLGEVMDYPGVLRREDGLMEKLRITRAAGKIINGHAPLLTGRALDRYISAGIFDDHECSSFDEAAERIGKGQRVMIRQGTAAKDLAALLPLFDEPWARRCLLVTDDKHPADLLRFGHIDDIIRQVVQGGRRAVTGIQMATIQAAEYFGLKGLGAVAPGYFADVLVLDDLNTVAVRDVYYRGKQVASGGRLLDDRPPVLTADMRGAVCNSFILDPLSAADFHLNYTGKKDCRVIRLIRHRLLTDEWRVPLDFDRCNGIDPARDILKLAVIERHQNTGHIGLGLISGTGIRAGAIASSVSHDSHNLVVIGADEEDMALAANRVRALGGGAAVVKGGQVLAEMPLPFAGLMTDAPAEEIARLNENVRRASHSLGAPEDTEPFMIMTFMCLPVIPHIKMTTKGLVDVDRQQLVPLVFDE